MILKDTNEMFADDLRDPEYAAGYLNITLEDDGIEGFLYALQKVARAHGVSKVALSSDVPRESLYRALSDKGNPSVKTLTRVLESLGLHLTVASTVQESCTAMDDQVEDRAVSQPLSHVRSVEVEVATIRAQMEEEFAVMRERAQAEQEAARRSTLALQEDAHRMIAHLEQLTAVMTEQARLAPARGGQGYRASTERNTIYSFPTRAGGQAHVNAELYEENPLKLVKVAA